MQVKQFQKNNHRKKYLQKKMIHMKIKVLT